MNEDAYFRTTLRIIPIFFLIFGLIMVSLQVYSQNGDDPNLDQLPRSMWNNIRSPGSSTITSTVITINNWDNYNLGVDFAESNMTANLAIPTWYFTAYNTNVGHQSEDGLNWESMVPDFGSTMMGDPVVAYDSLGNLFYGNMYGTNITLGLKVIKSTDNGTTWGPGITALNGTDKCWIACDQTNGPYANYVYTCMTNNNVGNFSRSTDHGQTYTSTFAPTTQNIPGMMVCVGPNNSVQGGSVFVVTSSGSSFATVYTFYRSIDGGLTFSKMSTEQFSNYVGTDVNGRNSVSGMRTRPYPMIAADNSYGPHRGRLYLVYASNDPPGDGNMPDIFSRFSDDGGTTWSTATKVNDDANTQNNNQWHPAIWCDKENGTLYIQWMDTRDTPTHDSAYIYASYSTDGGVTFAANQRISNQKMRIFCPSCGGGGTPSYQGDYNGIYSNKKVSMAGWTDFRYGTFLSTTAYFPDFAMAINHILDTLFTNLDSTLINISIPGVKLYTDTVLLSGTIVPLPVTGSIVISFPSGNIITSFPGTLPAKIKLTGAVPSGDYQAQFVAKGPNGTPVHQRVATIRVLSGNAVYVIASAAPDSICSGAPSQLMAKTIKGTPPFVFSWTPATGLNNAHIANPIASPIETTMYRVFVIDSVSHTASDSVTVNIISIPNQPGTIYGPELVCLDTIATYSIQSIPNAINYSWSVPNGANIISGQNTTSVTIHWGDIGGILSVIAGNRCGDSNPGVQDITVIGPPVPVVTIIGPDQVCSKEKVTFSVDPVPEATTYHWAVPSDATIETGQNTDSISVQWGSVAGNISIISINECGESLPLARYIGLGTVPGPAGTIAGNDTICSNYETYNFTVPFIIGASTYSWTVPVGTAIISGNGSKSIDLKISPEAESGLVTVQGKNNCGSGTVSEKNITVKICTGIYQNIIENDIRVYPNPASGLLTIEITNGEKIVYLHILDIRGQVVFQKALESTPSEFTHMVDVSAFSRGIYFLEFVNNNSFVIKKILLQ